MSEENTAPQETVQTRFTRREFLKIAGGVSASLALAACGIHPSPPTPPTVEVPKAAVAPAIIERQNDGVIQRLEEPSRFRVHVLRIPESMPDISLEKIQIIPVVYWANSSNVPVQFKSEIDSKIKLIYESVKAFWENALDRQTSITILPSIAVAGTARNPTEIMNLIEQKLKSPQASAVVNAAQTGNYVPLNSFPNFLSINVLTVSDQPGLYPNSAAIGMPFMSVERDAITNFHKHRTPNLVAHENGHGTFGAPDQYIEGDKWYNPDPFNIMGAGMGGHDLPDMSLDKKIKNFLLKH